VAAAKVGQSLRSCRFRRGTKQHRRTVLLGALVIVLVFILVPAGVVLATDDSSAAPSTTSTVTPGRTTTDQAPTTTESTPITTEPTTLSPETITPASPTTDTTGPAAGPVAAAALTRYNADSRLSYSGTWADFAKTAAYGGSYKRSSTAGASVTIVFDGVQFDWIAMKGTTTGIGDVYLDGTRVATINLANSVAVYQQNVWSSGTLPSGLHTVKIVRSASSASGKYLTIDAIDIAGTLIQGVEQGDSRLAYKGSWLSYSNAAYTGGNVEYSGSAGASVTIDFSGTYLAWVGAKSSNYGIAKVTLDETTTFEVDCYNPAALYQQTLWESGTLTSGAHTLKIEVTANKNAASAGTYLSVDAFRVAGTVTQAYALNRYEEDNPRVIYSGTWSTTSAPEASGGSDKRANTSAATASLTFTGARLDWIATTGPGMGVAVVSVDSGAAQSVDLSGSTTQYQQKVWSTGTLSAGTHKVQIAWDENNASGAIITLDAFDVLGTLPAPGTFTTAEIKWVEQKLADLSYLPGTINGVIDSKTRSAITAFQKWEGLTRDGNLNAAVWTRLQTASRPKPAKSGASNPWIEVNKTKQVLLYCKNGAVVYTLHCCTGSASVGIVTPSGTFKVLRKTLETSPLYLPMYFRPSPSVIAIHGYPSVPTSPASHGCVRTQLWDQDVLYPLIAVGTYLYIY
jgi:hypothetical protein